MKYTFYICGGEGTAYRGTREDSFKVVKMDLPSKDDIDWVVAWVSDNEYGFKTWKEFKEYMLEQGVLAKDLVSEIDPGFGMPFVYGVKDSSGKLVRDWDFEDIERERLDIWDDDEREVDVPRVDTSRNKELQAFASQNDFTRVGSWYATVTDSDYQVELFDFGDGSFSFTVYKYSPAGQKPVETLRTNNVKEVISLAKKYL